MDVAFLHLTCVSLIRHAKLEADAQLKHNNLIVISAPRHKLPNFLAFITTAFFGACVCLRYQFIALTVLFPNIYFFVVLFERCFNRISNFPIHFLKFLWAMTSLMMAMTSHIHDNESCDILLSLFGELLSMFLVSFFIL